MSEMLKTLPSGALEMLTKAILKREKKLNREIRRLSGLGLFKKSPKIPLQDELIFYSLHCFDRAAFVHMTANDRSDFINDLLSSVALKCLESRHNGSGETTIDAFFERAQTANVDYSSAKVSGDATTSIFSKFSYRTMDILANRDICLLPPLLSIAMTEFGAANRFVKGFATHPQPGAPS